MTSATDEREVDERRRHELGRRGSHAALQLAVRSVILRGLSFVGTIVLARLLDPADFGVYGIVAFVISVWAALGDLGLGAALVQQAEEPTPAQLRTVWTVQQALALTAVVLVWLGAPAALTIVPSLPLETTSMLRVLSLGLVFSSLRTLPVVMMERELRFGPLAVAEIAQMVVFYAVAVCLALRGAGAWAFVLGGIAQLGAGAAIVNLAWRRLPAVGFDRACLARLVGFSFDYQASVLLVTLRDAPLPALVVLVSGTVAAGLIQFAVRIALTIASIDETLARIAFPAFSRLQGHPQEQARALDTAILMTGLIVIPAQCWIAAVAPVLVPMVFGSQWSEAIVPVRIICLATLLRFPARYLRQAEFAEGRSRRGLAMTFATTLLALGSFGVGLIGWGLPGSAVGFLVGALLGLGASAWLAWGALQMSWRPFGLLLAAGLGAGGVAASTVLLVGRSLSPSGSAADSPWSTLLASVLATLVFAGTCSALLYLTSRPVLMMGRRWAARSIRG